MDSYYKYKKYKTLYKQLRGGVDDNEYKIGGSDEVTIETPRGEDGELTKCVIKIKDIVTFCYSPIKSWPEVILNRVGLPLAGLEYSPEVVDSQKVPVLAMVNSWPGKENYPIHPLTIDFPVPRMLMFYPTIEKDRAAHAGVWDKGMWALYIANAIQQDYRNIAEALATTGTREERRAELRERSTFSKLEKIHNAASTAYSSDVDARTWRDEAHAPDEEAIQAADQGRSALTENDIYSPTYMGTNYTAYLDLTKLLYSRYSMMDFEDLWLP